MLSTKALSFWCFLLRTKVSGVGVGEGMKFCRASEGGKVGFCCREISGIRSELKHVRR